MELSDKQIGYLAGIIDGEGCVSIRHQNNQRSYYATLQVGSTSIELISWLLETLGCGRVHIDKKSGNRKQSYKWLVTVARDIYSILDLVYPLLVIKKGQSDLLYRLREIKSRPLIRHGKQRGVYLLSDETVKDCKILFAKCKELNFRGLREKDGELLESPGRTISSQDLAGMLSKVQRLESESRTDSNLSTSAVPERDDIVRASQECEEGENKESRR